MHLLVSSSTTDLLLHRPDKCPNDPAKMEPGVCGCGQPETDADGDLVPDCVDECPKDPQKEKQGVCGESGQLCCGEATVSVRHWCMHAWLTAID